MFALFALYVVLKKMVFAVNGVLMVFAVNGVLMVFAVSMIQSSMRIKKLHDT